MVDMLIVIYFAGWLPTSLAAYAAAIRLADRQAPANRNSRVMLSVAAGVVWPLLVVGLVELSSVMVLAKVPPKPRQSIGIFA